MALVGPVPAVRVRPAMAVEVAAVTAAAQDRIDLVVATIAEDRDGDATNSSRRSRR